MLGASWVEGGGEDVADLINLSVEMFLFSFDVSSLRALMIRGW